MKEITLQIDGREVKAKEGATVLEAARAAGIDIPTICHHEELEPCGVCRLCLVEIGQAPRTKMVTSCIYTATDKLIVNTQTERVRKARKVLLELMLTRAPGSKRIKDLAAEYGANANRFKKDASFCILCGLCVRYCDEVKKANAITFISRGANREVMFIPEIAAKECPSCQKCFDLCPTNVLRANFEAAQALTFAKGEVA